MGAFLKQYAWAGNLLFVLLLSYYLAKITNVYVARLLEVPRSIGVVSGSGPIGAAAAPRELSEYEVIAKRNVFDSTEAATDQQGRPEESGEGPVNLTGEAVKTTLPIKVIAVMVIGDGKDGRSTTTVTSGNETDVYAVGDEKKVFAPGVRLVQVKPARIEFAHAGRLEYAELDQGLGENIFGPPKATLASAAPGPAAPGPVGEKVAKVAENKFAIDQTELDAALGNLDRLYTEIRAVPNFQEGKVQGMKILSIKPGSIFAKLGLKRGDVLARINGVELDIKKGFELFNQLKDQKNFSLDLQRDGKNQTMDYEIR